MPLSFCETGKENIIKKIGGNPEVKKHLEELGFSAGGIAVVIAESNENIIVKIKEARIALGKDLALKIMV